MGPRLRTASLVAAILAVVLVGSLIAFIGRTSPDGDTTKVQQAEAAAIPSSLRNKNVTRIPTTKKIVALTFDGGGDATGVASIRATLREKKAKATFFLTGDFVRSFPTKSRQLAATGRIGNHSNTHLDFTKISDTKARNQVLNAQSAIISTTGENPRPLFRFPFGAYTSADIRQVNKLGYIPVGWTVDTLGWKGTSGGMSKTKVVNRVVNTLRPGQIVLMHLGANPKDKTTLDAAALPAIIEKLRARGYSFVTLDALTA